MARIVAILGIAVSSNFSSLMAQPGVQSPSVDPEREIIVMYRLGAVSPPAGSTEGLVDDFEIPSMELRQVLQAANIEVMSRLIPDFESQDRFRVSRTGEMVELTDWSNVYLVRLPTAQERAFLVEALAGRPEVIYVEINGIGEPDGTPFIPDDDDFPKQWNMNNTGAPDQGGGTPDADIDGPEAWDIRTGSSAIKIAIVDNGMRTNHADFAGRVTGDAGDNSSHGTDIAGVAAAQGNNTIGVAGVAWNVAIINEDYGAASDADFINAVNSAVNRGAHVVNNSWKLMPVGRNSSAVQQAFVDAYNMNTVLVASMGNQQGNVIQYPAAYEDIVIAVGGTTPEDVKGLYSSTGNWLDVVAPGGCGGQYGFNCNENGTDDIWTTGGNGGYHYAAFTSVATPHITGMAALLLSENANLYNDDITQIIRASADKVPEMNGQNFTQEHGYGRVNARRALSFLQSPYVLNQWSANNGSTYGAPIEGFTTFYGVDLPVDGEWWAIRYEVRETVTFP